MTRLADRKRKCKSCDGEGCSACNHTGKKPTKLSFETDAEIRYRGQMRPIVVEPGPFYCRLRLKGTQLAYEVSWESMYVRGAELFADRKKRECRFCEGTGIDDVENAACLACNGTGRKAKKRLARRKRL